jgi:hypothetical protein
MKTQNRGEAVYSRAIAGTAWERTGARLQIIDAVNRGPAMEEALTAALEYLEALEALEPTEETAALCELIRRALAPLF